MNFSVTTADLDALLPAILPSSRGFRLRIASPRQVDGTGDRAFIRFHLIPAVVALWRGKSAKREGEL